MSAGFKPDCISSDVHTLSIRGLAYDQLVTLSKFLALGMSLPEVIHASTAGPAQAIGKPGLGTLDIGTPGDVSVLRLETGEFEFQDVHGLIPSGRERLAIADLIIDGKLWRSSQGTSEPT